jgi:hypothetical protein
MAGKYDTLIQANCRYVNCMERKSSRKYANLRRHGVRDCSKKVHKEDNTMERTVAWTGREKFQTQFCRTVA